MKKFIKTFSLAGLCLVNHLAHAAPPTPAGLELLNNATQLIVVTTDTWDSVQGQLQQFVRKNPQQPWQPVAPAWPVVVGKNGLGWAANLEGYGLQGPFKQEGDGKAPAGVFTLTSAFGFAATPDSQIKLSYRPIIATTVCVDDQHSQYYGRMMDSSNVPVPDWRSGEIMSQYPIQYNQGIVVDYNTQGQWPGKGSCIFLHIFADADSKGTFGCTAMAKENVSKLLQWLDPTANPVLVQLPKVQYQQLQAAWKLP